jgi:MFS family permease
MWRGACESKLTVMQIALTYPRFGRLLAALAASSLGDWLYNLALLAYVQERTHSPAWLGAVTAARVAPIVIGGPLGGLVADRFDRRRAMILADLLRAGLMGALVLAAVLGLPVIVVPLLAGTATLAGIPYPSCVAAVTPRLVPDEALAAANGARATIAPACVAAGPALGAVLLLFGSPAVAFAINALTFLISCVLVASIASGPEFVPARHAPNPAGHGPHPAADAPNPAADARNPAVRHPLAEALAEIREGARALAAAPEAGWMVGADIAASFVYGSQTVLLLLVADRLGLGAAGYGYLLAAQGAGGVIGATVAGRLGQAAGRRSTLALALALVALPLPLLAVTGSVAVAIALGLVAGAGALVVEVVADTRLQRTLEETRLGCAYGFAFAASIGGIAVGAVAAPGLVSLAGVTGSLCAIGAAVLALAVAMAIGGRTPAPRAATVLAAAEA